MPAAGPHPRIGLSSPILASQPPRPSNAIRPPREAPHSDHDSAGMFPRPGGSPRSSAHSPTDRPSDPRLSVVELEFTMNGADGDIPVRPGGRCRITEGRRIAMRDRRGAWAAKSCGALALMLALVGLMMAQ